MYFALYLLRCDAVNKQIICQFSLLLLIISCKYESFVDVLVRSLHVKFCSIGHGVAFSRTCHSFRSGLTFCLAKCSSRSSGPPGSCAALPRPRRSRPRSEAARATVSTSARAAAETCGRRAAPAARVPWGGRGHLRGRGEKGVRERTWPYTDLRRQGNRFVPVRIL